MKNDASGSERVSLPVRRGRISAHQSLNVTRPMPGEGNLAQKRDWAKVRKESETRGRGETLGPLPRR